MVCMALDDIESGNLPDLPAVLRILVTIAWRQGYHVAEVDLSG
jgi:hypothetical protein